MLRFVAAAAAFEKHKLHHCIALHSMPFHQMIPLNSIAMNKSSTRMDMALFWSSIFFFGLHHTQTPTIDINNATVHLWPFKKLDKVFQTFFTHNKHYLLVVFCFFVWIHFVLHFFLGLFDFCLWVAFSIQINFIILIKLFHAPGQQNKHHTNAAEPMNSLFLYMCA